MTKCAYLLRRVPTGTRTISALELVENNTVIMGPSGYNAALPAIGPERFYRARWLTGP